MNTTIFLLLLINVGLTLFYILNIRFNIRLNDSIDNNNLRLSKIYSEVLELSLKTDQLGIKIAEIKEKLDKKDASEECESNTKSV